jgi:hypothetical protein
MCSCRDFGMVVNVASLSCSARSSGRVYKWWQSFLNYQLSTTKLAAAQGSADWPGASAINLRTGNTATGLEPARPCRSLLLNRLVAPRSDPLHLQRAAAWSAFTLAWLAASMDPTPLATSCSSCRRDVPDHRGSQRTATKTSFHCGVRSTACSGHARSGSRSAILPALPCSGSAAKSGIGDLGCLRP